MEQVMNNTSKIMLDVEGGNNLLYLPLDRIIPNNQGTAAVPQNILPQLTPDTNTRRSQNDRRDRDNLRSRVIR
jgi:membrane protease subunit HflK